jgi:DDB1- and CUL4-associated factor 11
VRCSFSPLHSTAQRFVYTGSATGEVFIYDTSSGALHSRVGAHEDVVREASWHPSRPSLVIASWDGRAVEHGFCADAAAAGSGAGAAAAQDHDHR